MVLDTIRWFWRVMMVLFTAVALVSIATFTIPNVDMPELRSDIMAGRVVFNGGFTSPTGVIIQEDFTQDVANEHIVFAAATDREDILRMGIVARLQTADFDERIVYNPEGESLARPLTDLDNVDQDTRVFPVSVRRPDGTLTGGTLTVEVLYAG